METDSYTLNFTSTVSANTPE